MGRDGQRGQACALMRSSARRASHGAADVSRPLLVPGQVRADENERKARPCSRRTPCPPALSSCPSRARSGMPRHAGHLAHARRGRGPIGGACGRCGRRTHAERVLAPAHRQKLSLRPPCSDAPAPPPPSSQSGRSARRRTDPPAAGPLAGDSGASSFVRRGAAKKNEERAVSYTVRRTNSAPHGGARFAPPSARTQAPRAHKMAGPKPVSVSEESEERRRRQHQTPRPPPHALSVPLSQPCPLHPLSLFRPPAPRPRPPF